MKGKGTIIRLVQLAALFLLVSIFASQQTEAQVIPCNNCDYLTIATDENVGCIFDICIIPADGGNKYCAPVWPGHRFNLPCYEGATIVIINCRGERVFINTDCAAPQIVPISATCCVSVCVTKNLVGCILIRVDPAPAPCSKCPL